MRTIGRGAKQLRRTGVSADGSRQWRAIAILIGVGILGGGPAGAASAETNGQPAPQRPGTLSIAPVTTGPLAAFSVSGGAVTCIQSAAAVDAQGAVGVLAPQIGATVVRGSASASPSLVWTVVPREQIGAGTSTLTVVCVPSQ